MFNRTKRIDGMKFGMLTAIAPSHMVGKQVYYHFQCDCGEKRVFRKCNVVTESRGNVRHCGCLSGRENLLGKKFGKLTVIEKRGITTTRNRLWLCKCSCGNERELPADKLRAGRRGSCGCSYRVESSGRFVPERNLWKMMIARCYDEKSSGYRNYGARGIRVCDRWRDSFDAFFSDMGRRPDGMTLERVNNEGNYEPSNVIWADMKTQNRNKRDNLDYKDRYPDAKL